MDALKNGYVAPFPFLCASLAIIFLAIAGYIRNQHSYIITNILLSITPLLLVANIVQVIFCIFNNNGFYNFFFILFGILSFIALNITFGIKFYKYIKVDYSFESWKNLHNISSKFINIFGWGFSFHVFRLLYSRFLGFELFACRMSHKTYDLFFSNIQIVTILSIFLTYVPVIIGDIVGLIYIPWTTQLNVMLIETLIMSILLLILSILELHKSKLSLEELIGKEPMDSYELLKNTINEMRKSWINSGKLKEDISSIPRSSSWGHLEYVSQEEKNDERNLRSDPPTPKILKQIKVKFKKYKINEESLFVQPYFDNVDSNVNLEPKKAEFPTKDFCQQTNPLEKIRNFRRMMRLQDEMDRIKRNKLKSAMEIIKEEDYSKMQANKGKLI